MIYDQSEFNLRCQKPHGVEPGAWKSPNLTRLSQDLRIDKLDNKCSRGKKKKYAIASRDGSEKMDNLPVCYWEYEQLE